MLAFRTHSRANGIDVVLSVNGVAKEQRNMKDPTLRGSNFRAAWASESASGTQGHVVKKKKRHGLL